MTTSSLPFESDALRANLASTAQQVTIPDRYLPLIEAVRGFYGVRTPLTETLAEYFHTYRNADALIEGFQVILLRNWTYFERSDDRAHLFSLCSELVRGLLEDKLSRPQFSALLRIALMWSTDALGGPHSDQYDAGLLDMNRLLGLRLHEQPIAFLERDALLRALVERTADRPAIAEAFFKLYRSVLLRGYRIAAERLDVPRWAASPDGELTDAGAVAAAFAFLDKGPLSVLLRRAESGSTSQLLSSDLPTFSDLLDRIIAQIYQIHDLEDRFAVCLYLLKDETMGYRQHEVMADLLDVVKQMLGPSTGHDVDRILTRLTVFFRGREDEFLLMRFRCYEAIGVAIGEAGNAKAADHLINDILYWHFQYPDIAGATDEWETVVNPYHLPKIRTWMRIIESNPALYERLAAALNVQLRLGGVYIADTDLFQRDVTRFLNADIRPIYFVAKQLLRTLPVYFNDVGAEGELRAVSTEIDEICHRHDTLMHFLRKQAHTESSARLVSFSRAVLRYWMTLDPSGLTPFLSNSTAAAVSSELEWALGPRDVLEALRQRLPAVSDAAGAGRADPGGNGRSQAAHDQTAAGADRAAVARSDPGLGDPAVDSFLDQLVSLSPQELQRLLDELVLAADLAEQAPSGEAGGDSGSKAAREGRDRRAEADGGNGSRPDGAVAVTAEAVGARDHRRVSLMVRMHQLLADKYSLSTGGVGDAVGRFLRLGSRTRTVFQNALVAWSSAPGHATRDRLIDASLSVLEELKTIVLDPVPSEPAENIYQKRHLAAGIPSIYGNYSEPKFDALGLSFRVENLVRRLLDDLVAEGTDLFVTRESLRRMAADMRRFERALVVDGVDSRALGTNLALLEASFASHNFTFHQYQNVFQFLAQSVALLSTSSVLSHNQILRTVLVHDPRQCEARSMTVDAVAEMVLREVLVSALGMQSLDQYVVSALRQISTLQGRLNGQALTRMMNYDPERLVSPIHVRRPRTDDQMSLGFKGLGLKQIASYGHRVPPGFILSTELFGARPAMSYRPLYADMLRRVRRALDRLERTTRLRLGDLARPLVLSIRSGAAISMPGLMSTFVNVGLNDSLAEALARRPGYEWAAWDGYRRFLQAWAMSDGIDRDFFDAIMGEFKSRYEIIRKIEFTPQQMREMAYTYKLRAREAGVSFVDDPFRQVMACVLKVLDSWDTPHARIYRDYVGIAEEWGTAVVIQRMVFGNLGPRSGSGVVFTHNPLEPYTHQVRLFGDYAVSTQGEDLVGGLVFPLPITEAQRRGSPAYRGSEHSLERDFPEIYRELLHVATDLVSEHEYDPQEIEFTFESPEPQDLYILQKRTVVQEQAKDAPYFDTAAENYGAPVAIGMGVSGGAYSGRAAVNAQQIDRLLAESPDQHIVLLRPDTVPEDIGMITRVEGILTARGGATSHAAVTAKRLGKTAVVDCEDLLVMEDSGSVRLAGVELQAGEWLSIDGRTGNIFLGRIPTRSGPAVLSGP